MVLPSTPQLLRPAASSGRHLPDQPVHRQRRQPAADRGLDAERRGRLAPHRLGRRHRGTLWKTTTREPAACSPTSASTASSRRTRCFFPPELNFEPVDDGLPGTSLFGTSENLQPQRRRSTLVHSYTPDGQAARPPPPPPASSSRSATSTSVYVVSRNLNAGQPNVDSGTQRQRAPGPRSWCATAATTSRRRCCCWTSGSRWWARVRGEQSSINGDPNKLFFYPKLATAYRLPALRPGGERAQGARSPTARRATSRCTARSSPRCAPPTTSRATRASLGTRHRRRPGHPARAPARGRGRRGRHLLRRRRSCSELTVYQRNITDLLLQRALAPSTGFTTQFFNGGELRNRGVEAMVQVTPGATAATSSGSSRTTFTLNRSKVTDLPVPAFTAGGFGTAWAPSASRKGASATQIVGNVGRTRTAPAAT